VSGFSRTVPRSAWRRTLRTPRVSAAHTPSPERRCDSGNTDHLQSPRASPGRAFGQERNHRRAPVGFSGDDLSKFRQVRLGHAL